MLLEHLCPWLRHSPPLAQRDSISMEATRNGQQHLFRYKTPKHQHLPFSKAFILGQVEILCRYFYQMWRFTGKKQLCLEISEGFTMESKSLVLLLMEKPPTRHMFFDTLRNGHWKEL